MKRALATLLLAATGACYAPAYPSCVYSCVNAGPCPEGLTCNGLTCAASGITCDGDPPGLDAAQANCGDGMFTPGEFCPGATFALPPGPTVLRDVHIVDLGGSIEGDFVGLGGTIVVVWQSSAAAPPAIDPDRAVGTRSAAQRMTVADGADGGAPELYLVGANSVESYTIAGGSLVFTHQLTSSVPASPALDVEVVRYIPTKSALVGVWNNQVVQWPIGTNNTLGPIESVASGGLGFSGVAPLPSAADDDRQGVIANQGSQLVRRWLDTTDPLADIPLGAIVPADLATGDIDGDGVVDVVLTDRASDSVFVMWGDRGAMSGYREPVPLLVEAGRGAVIEILDVDGDAYGDILYTTSPVDGARLHVQRGGPDRAALPLESRIGVGLESIMDIHVGQYNADGAPDIVVTGLPAGAVVIPSDHVPRS